MRYHSARLDTPVSIAADIRRRLKTLFPLMDEMVQSCCHICTTPCCIFNRVWFDFPDLLFLHLLGERIPPAQLSTGAADNPCCYLAGDGCQIPRIMRPWGCFAYICPSNRDYLKRKKRAVGIHLGQELGRIRALRIDMEESFNRTVLNNSHASRERLNGNT